MNKRFTRPFKQFKVGAVVIFSQLPLVRLKITRQNFVFKSSKLWNDLSTVLLMDCAPTESGLIIPGSEKNSDLAASTGVIKGKLKSYLLSQQNSGYVFVW